MTPIHCLHPIFSIPGIHLVHMHHAITALFSEMPELKTPQMVRTAQMGKAFIGFPKWLFSWPAWKKTKPYMTLFHFPPLSMYAWLNETEFSSRSQRVVKVSTLFVTPGKEGSGHCIPGKESSLRHLFCIWTSCRAGNITKLICKIAVGEESEISIGHKPEMSSVLNSISLDLAMLTVNYF